MAPSEFFRVGGGATNYEYMLRGAIDEPRIYQRALSADEVQELYVYESQPPAANNKRPVSSGPPPRINEGLVAYYPFDGNLKDLSGHGNDARPPSNGQPRWSPDRHGRPQSALKTTVNRPLTLPTRDLPKNAEDRSLVMWVRFSDQTPAKSFHTVFLAGTAETRGGDDINRKSWKLHLTGRDIIGNGGSGQLRIDWHGESTPVTTTPVNDGKWRHVIWTLSNNTSVFYINGRIMHSMKFVTNTVNTAAQLGGMDGFLDDVRIYNRALSAEEAKAFFEHERNDATRTVPTSGDLSDIPEQNPDATTGQEPLTLKGHTDWVYGVAFSPDGKRLASASRDQTVKVWDATSNQETLTLKGHTGWVFSVAFSPDGKRLASGGQDGMVKVRDATSGQETLTLKAHTGDVLRVAFSPDGKRLASAGQDGTVKVWDATSGQETLTLKGHTSYVGNVAFSPDGKRLASGSGDKTLKVWDATSGQETLTLKGHTGPVYHEAFSPDGKWLASASHDGTVKLWNATSGQETLTLNGHTSEVYGLAFSPDGKRLVSASGDKSVKVWDATSGQETLTLEGHTNTVYSVAFSPDGNRLASASQDQTVKVWNITPLAAAGVQK